MRFAPLSLLGALAAPFLLATTIRQAPPREDTQPGLANKAAFINVKASPYSAVGDGVTDDTTAIQTALNLSSQTVVIPCGTYNVGALTIAAAASMRIKGAARDCVTLTYVGSGTALTVGTSSADTTSVVVEGIKIDVSGGTAANALKFVRATGGAIRDVYILGATSGTDSGKGLMLDGTGNFTGSITVDRVRINGNFAVGLDTSGPSINTCNHIDFRQLSIARTTAKPGTGTIGFRWHQNCGDGAALIPDVENYDTGFEIDGRYFVGTLRAENNTTGVNFGAAAVTNTLFLQPALNTANVGGLTAGGSNNTVFDPLGFTQTVNNGTTDSQLNLVDTTDHRISFQFRAGSAAEQQEQIRWLTKNGTLAGQWQKTAGNDVQFEDGSANILIRYASGNAGILLPQARNKGTITLNAGTGTATVTTGSVCTCIDTTTANLLKCAVAANTLTATGTGTDVIAYHCF